MRKTATPGIFVLLLLSMIPSCTSLKYETMRRQALEWYPAEKPFPESEFLHIEGVRLHVRQWFPRNSRGDPPKGVVFLVHGVSGSTYNWRFLAPALADDGWNVLTADLPPFGFSGEKQPAGFSLDPLPQDSPSRAELLWHLFDALYPDYSGTAVIVGHSLGGRIAALMTLSRPVKATKLVLLAPAVYGSSAIPAVTRYWPFNKIVVPGARMALNSLSIIRFVVNKAYGEAVSDDDLIGNWAPFLREGVPEACAEWSIKSLDTEAPDVSEIEVTTLILWSRKDAIVPNKGKKLQEEISGSLYCEIPGRSHCIMDTDPEAVNPLILGFINREE